MPLLPTPCRSPQLWGGLCAPHSARAPPRPFLPPVNGASSRPRGSPPPNQPFSVLLNHLPHEPKTSRQLKTKPDEAGRTQGHAGATTWPAPAHAPSPQSALASAAHGPEPQCLPALDKRGVTPPSASTRFTISSFLETRSGNTRPVPTCQKAGPSPPSRGLNKTAVRLITCPQAWASRSYV